MNDGDVLAYIAGAVDARQLATLACCCRAMASACRVAVPATTLVRAIVRRRQSLRDFTLRNKSGPWTPRWTAVIADAWMRTTAHDRLHPNRPSLKLYIPSDRQCKRVCVHRDHVSLPYMHVVQPGADDGSPGLGLFDSAMQTFCIGGGDGDQWLDRTVASLRRMSDAPFCTRVIGVERRTRRRWLIVFSGVVRPAPGAIVGKLSFYVIDDGGGDDPLDTSRVLRGWTRRVVGAMKDDRLGIRCRSDEETRVDNLARIIIHRVRCSAFLRVGETASAYAARLARACAQYDLFVA